VQSNCVSIEPLETEFGRKRRINQSSCNKDYSCLKGFCPSLVTIEGGEPRQAAPVDLPELERLPEAPAPLALDEPYNIAVAGVGGTGVLTIGALIGMAAHIEGKASLILDVSGLAQKGGAVLSHVRVGREPADVTCSRIVTGSADLLIAADEVVAVARDTLSLCDGARTAAVINAHLIPTSDFVRDRDFDFRQERVAAALRDTVRADSAWIDFTAASERLIGDSIATNIMMLGFAGQKGWLPVSAASIARAIDLNAVSVKANRLAFGLGRLAAADPARFAELSREEVVAPVTLESMALDEIISHRAGFLARYQSAALADRYRALVLRARNAASVLGLGEELARAAAINYAKLLAYKDEYEVARLFTDGAFARALGEQFTGDFTIAYHLAPPFLGGTDGRGRPRKRRFGAWMTPVLRVFAALRRVRGTAFDPFGYTAERRRERAMIAAYEDDVALVLERLTPERAETALALLSLPGEVRGFGPVKDAAHEAARATRRKLREALAAPASPRADGDEGMRAAAAE
jgi:indolepyruvate ferredoxin oxidoreductase